MSIERPQAPPDGFSGEVLYLIYSDRSIYAVDGKVAFSDLPASLSLDEGELFFIGCNDDIALYAIYFDAVEIDGFYDLRTIYGTLSDESFMFASTGMNLVNWYNSMKFCSLCGGETVHLSGKRDISCGSCGKRYFPRISPAVIVAVTDGESILLAHNRKARAGFYSLIAGFIESGETPEEAVAREVKEEVGVDIEDICYVMSQPWPFPDSLMLGFTAKYSGGDIAVDGEEIVDAGWYQRKNLPSDIPGPKALAGRLIRAFLN